MDVAPRKHVDLFCEIVEAVIEIRCRIASAAKSIAMAATRVFADRGFEPFPDRTALAARGFPGGVPAIRVDRAYAPGHACAHYRSILRGAGDGIRPVSKGAAPLP